MLQLKLQYFGHLTQRADSLEKPPMLGKIEGRRRRGWQRMRWVGWHHWLNGHEFEQALGDGEGQEAWRAAVHGVTKSQTRQQLNNNICIYTYIYIRFFFIIGYYKLLNVCCALQCKWKSLSRVQFIAIPWTIQSMEFSLARILEWVAFPISRGSLPPRNRTQVSRVSGRFFTSWATREVLP